jgi:quercetin dioxygenase-like cupin family protein
MFAHRSDSGYEQSAPGIARKTLVYGKQTLMAEFRLKKGSVLPRHAHPHEQTGYLVSGHMTLQIGDRKEEILPGDSWNIPSDAEHGAVVHENSVAVEVFQPLREDYLP